MISEALSLPWWQGLSFLLHIFLEVELQVLENQVELLLAEEHLSKLNNVRVLQVLQQRNLTDSCTRNAVIFFLESNFLDCHSFIGFQVPRLINDAISALAELLQLLVLVQIAHRLR